MTEPKTPSVVDQCDSMPQGCRRFELMRYAQTVLKETNKAQALRKIIDKAAENLSEESRPADKLINDLTAVLIGTDLRSGRGRGKYFVGYQEGYKGAEGFAHELRDPYFQVQHAMAGVVIGYKFGLAGQWWAMAWEQEEQDDRLYKLTCPIGRELRNTNYQKLGQRVYDAIREQPTRKNAK